MTIVTYVLYFFVYSAGGWLMESLACSHAQKRWINRGFLTGPLCPIYGTGAVALSLLLTPLRAHPLLVCLLGMLITDVVEYITSVLMERLFHARWWDYSEQKYNIKGRICLKNTLYWGIATLGFLYLVHPVVSFVFHKIPPVAVYVILGIVLAIFCVDLIYAFKNAADLRKIKDTLKKVYDKLSLKPAPAELMDSKKQVDQTEETLEELHEGRKLSRHDPARILRSNPRIERELRNFLRDVKRLLIQEDEERY